MAESVASLLRRSLGHLAAEVPESYRRLLAELGPLVVQMEVDGEAFSMRRRTGIDVTEGGDDAAGARVATSRAAIIDVLDAVVSLSEAVESDRVVVRGSLDDIVRAHDALLAYAHAAVRARSIPGLVTALREGVDGG
jgi:hypothetical protein